MYQDGAIAHKQITELNWKS